MIKNTKHSSGGPFAIASLALVAALSGCMMEPGEIGEYDSYYPYAPEADEVQANTAALHNSGIWNNPHDAIGYITDGETDCIAWLARFVYETELNTNWRTVFVTDPTCFEEGTSATYVHPTRGELPGYVTNDYALGRLGIFLDFYESEDTYALRTQEPIDVYFPHLTGALNRNLPVRLVGGNRNGVGCTQELPRFTLTTSTVVGLTTISNDEHRLVASPGRTTGVCDVGYGDSGRGGPLMALIGGRWLAIGMNQQSGLESQSTGNWVSKFRPMRSALCGAEGEEMPGGQTDTGGIWEGNIGGYWCRQDLF